MGSDALTGQEASSGPVQSRDPPGRGVSGRGAGCGAGLGRTVRRGSLGLLLALSSPAQPLGAGHRHGVERQEPRQPCPVRRGETRERTGPHPCPHPRRPPHAYPGASRRAGTAARRSLASTAAAPG